MVSDRSDIVLQWKVKLILIMYCIVKFFSDTKEALWKETRGLGSPSF